MDTDCLAVFFILAIIAFSRVGSDLCEDPPPVSCDPSLLGFFPHALDCDKFIYCVKGRLYGFSCSPGEWWDQDRQICDKPKNVECLSCNVPSLIPTASSCVGRIQFVPHETNCKKFYHCANGFKIEKSCPSFLYFNPRLNVCDWSAYRSNCYYR